MCFVPFSVPGDRLRIRILRENKKIIRGEIVDILEAGHGRRQPVCVAFGMCGGCQWLHVTEEVQRAAKRALPLALLGGIPVEVEPSAHPLGYRRLARLHAEPSEWGIAVGFSHSRDAVGGACDRCPILDAPLESLGAAEGKTIRLSMGRQTGEVRLASGNGGVVAVISVEGPVESEFYQAAPKWFPMCLRVWGSCWTGSTHRSPEREPPGQPGGDAGPLGFPPRVSDRPTGRSMSSLENTVSSWVASGGYSRGLELFSGAGNLTVAIAPHLEPLNASELDGRPARGAGAIVQGESRIPTVFAGIPWTPTPSTTGAATSWSWTRRRTGHRELARAMAAGKHRGILYVSCNPATLGRDLDELLQGGYKVARAQGFDMFPQTAHMEAAVLLER